MLNVLVVSPSARTVDLFRNYIAAEVPEKVYAVSSGAEARRCLTERYYDLIFIDAPLPDEFGNELAVYSVDMRSPQNVVIAVKADRCDDLLSYVGNEWVIVVAKPLNRTQIVQTIRIIEASQDRFEIISRTNAKLRERLDEIHVIDKAKYMLVDKMRISENEAYRYIEKKAMDERISKYKVSQRILESFN